MFTHAMDLQYVNSKWIQIYDYMKIKQKHSLHVISTITIQILFHVGYLNRTRLNIYMVAVVFLFYVTFRYLNHALC